MLAIPILNSSGAFSHTVLHSDGSTCFRKDACARHLLPFFFRLDDCGRTRLIQPFGPPPCKEKKRRRKEKKKKKEEQDNVSLSPTQHFFLFSQWQRRPMKKKKIDLLKKEKKSFEEKLTDTISCTLTHLIHG